MVSDLKYGLKFVFKIKVRVSNDSSRHVGVSCFWLDLNLLFVVFCMFTGTFFQKSPGCLCVCMSHGRPKRVDIKLMQN